MGFASAGAETTPTGTLVNPSGGGDGRLPEEMDFDELLDVAKLRVKSLIGRGGFAAVFAGTYDGTPVALKVLQPAECQKASEQEYVRMFLREAVLTKRLEHRHVVRCLGIMKLPAQFPGVNNKKVQWAMCLELCESYTTKSLITQAYVEARRTYTTLQAYDWLLQIAEALLHLHSLTPAVIHRDIKQENVLLKKENGELVVKLADLGLHVTLESDRSVMLRRKTTGLESQSVHGGPRKRSSLAPGDGGGTPFLAVSAAPSQQPSRAPSSTLIGAAAEQLADGGFDDTSAGRSAPGDGQLMEVASLTVPSIPASLRPAPARPALASPSRLAQGAGDLDFPALPAAGGTMGLMADQPSGGAGAAGPIVLGQLPASRRASEGLASPRRISVHMDPDRTKSPSRPQSPPPNPFAAAEAGPNSKGPQQQELQAQAQAQAPPMLLPICSFAHNFDGPIPHAPSSRFTLPGAASLRFGPSLALQANGSPASAGTPVGSTTPTALATANQHATTTPQAAGSPRSRKPSPLAVGSAVSRMPKPSLAARPPSAHELSAHVTGDALTAAEAAGAEPELAPRPSRGILPPLDRVSAPVPTALAAQRGNAPGARHSAPSCGPAAGRGVGVAGACSAPASPKGLAPVSPRTRSPAERHREGHAAARGFGRHGGAKQAAQPDVRTYYSSAFQIDGSAGSFSSACSGVTPLRHGVTKDELASSAASPAQSPGGGGVAVPVPPRPSLKRLVASTSVLVPAGDQDDSVGKAAANAKGRANGAGGDGNGERRVRYAIVSEPLANFGLTIPDGNNGSPRAGPVATLLRTPGAVRPVTSDGSFTAGMRRVKSILQQFKSTDMSQLRQGSIEWVFGLTGKAGSCLYMAPEVYRKLPYNEKADVFSFAVMMYELLSRELLVVKFFNTHVGYQMGWSEPEDYAEAVCNGYRPGHNSILGQGPWDLIQRCWHDDPVQRPSMAQVLKELHVLRELEALKPSSAANGCCVIS